MTDSTGSGPQQPQQPAEIDPEQLRQFQEFQRFQEYQKFQQAQQGQAPLALPPGEVGPASQPPAVPPPVQTVYVKPEPKPMWQIILGSKLVRWLVMLVILLLLANYGYNRWFGGGDDPGNQARDSQRNNGATVPKVPYGNQSTMEMFYKAVAHDTPPQACNLFADDGQARKKFTEAFGASDCLTAIHTLNGQMTSKPQYETPYFPDSMLTPPKTSVVVVSSCHDLTIKGGRMLGRFVLSKQADNGWLITDYEAEPESADCLGSL